jgi:uroporphyrinogen decarboxylase
MMTNKDVARMAIELVRPPRIPVTLIAGGEWYVHSAGQTFHELTTSPEKLADVFVRAFRVVGHDLMWIGAGLLNYPAHFLGCPIEDFSSSSPVLTGPAITSLEELDSLSEDLVSSHPKMEIMVKAHHLIADEIGDETLILLTQWGPFTTAGRILGIEKLMMALVEDPGRVTELITLTTEINWAVSQRVMAHPKIAGVNFSEPLASGDMISPLLFKKFVSPFLKELVSRTRNAERYSMIHICGNSTPLLNEILEIRPHAMSLEEKVDLRKAKEVLAGKICVAGNLSPTGVFLSGRPEHVIEEAKACLEAWGSDPGYILTVGCDFPKEVPLENVQALMSMKKVGSV